ncbi:dihydrolipoyl dehydrogenase [Bacillus canaveralius]|uniref:dihydrolipoyl dehydrogenase n=1 Tax=Bacillus canaveralius TaxID=1403243 RepID=UPI000F76BED5|nr:dihydrolipoyl dehydrogenase [Bacillus canaveralius]RSK47617.1 dihydrolipoyl dehydrogenase [Bacillus canaveralius]
MVVGELVQECDVIVIGGGPGGYNAAIRAAQLGRSVVIIEKEKLGGVCLHSGCIPSKVLAAAAAQLHMIGNSALFGIRTGETEFDLAELTNHKNKVVNQLHAGVAALCKDNKIEIVHGSAYFLPGDRIAVENGDHYEVFQYRNAIIATGSTPVIPEVIPYDGERIFTGRSITSIQIVPEKLLVYGSDYIALETAVSFKQFGADVTIILEERKHDFSFDASINRELKRILKKNGIKVIKDVALQNVTVENAKVKIILQTEKETLDLQGSHLCISLASKPNLEELGLDRIGVEMEGDGYVNIDEQCRTSKSNVFAIGDVTAGPALAVKAIKQGKTAAETIAGQAAEVDLNLLPMIVHTIPPIAAAGLTEADAITEGYEIVTSQFPLAANGYAAIHDQRAGFVKVIFDKKNDILLGVHIFGFGAVELISAGTIAMEMAARDEDLIFPHYPHPSVNEALLEAVEAIKGNAIHLAPPQRKEKVKS